MRHAIVRGGIVENICEWDGSAKWAPERDCQAVRDDKGEAEIGGGYSGGAFTPAPQREAREPERFDEVSLREAFLAFTEAQVRNGLYTAVKGRAILEDALAALKR